MKHREVASRLTESHVGVPVAAAEQHRAVRLLTHLQHLGHALGADHPRVVVVQEQRAEMRGEAAQVCRRQRLILEDHDQVLGEGGPDRGEDGLGRITAQGDTAQDGAQVRRQRLDLDLAQGAAPRQSRPAPRR